MLISKLRVVFFAEIQSFFYFKKKLEALQEAKSEKSGGIPKKWKVKAFLNNGKDEKRMIKVKV